MSFNFDSGLFKFDFTDHHAVLGVAVDAEAKDIRQRYLKIARRLHPDSCSAQNEAEKQWASQLLSKLVNPAYEKLSSASSRAEYIVLLTQMGKRFVKESTSIELKNNLSKQLAQTDNIDQVYTTSLYQLAEKQYDSFDQVLQLIAQISELNLVYLMRQGGKEIQSPSPQVVSTKSDEPKRDTQPPPEPESIVEQYYRRAQVLMAKNSFAQARVELQDALKLDPNNSRCHSLIGVVYLKQNQNTMAKIHIRKALQLNPQEPLALKSKQFLDQLAQKAGGQTSAYSNTTGGGLFGGMFGKKKK